MLVLRIKKGLFEGKVIIEPEQVFNKINEYNSQGFECMVDIE